MLNVLLRNIDRKFSHLRYRLSSNAAQPPPRFVPKRDASWDGERPGPRPKVKLHRLVVGLAAVGVAAGGLAQSLPERPFPAESGKLRVEAGRFFDAQGRVWRWRGASQFLLFARYLDGEDIAPVLDWLVERGFNVVRVFGQVPAGFGAGRIGITEYDRPFERPEFDRKLHEFFSLLADRGLRVEYVPLTYSSDLGVMRRHVQRVYDVARSHWNVLVEVGNEPEHNRIDVVAVMNGVNRHGVLSAYGLDPSRQPEGQDVRVPVLDYGTTHDIYREFDRSPRITREALEWQSRFGVPFVSDEPIGFIDFDHPFFVRQGTDPMGGALFGDPRGGGARTTNCDVIRSAAAIAYLLTAGYTFHLQAGVEGWRPEPSEPLQEACARSLAEIAAFIPNETQLGKLVEPGMSEFALAWTGRPGAESLVDRAYGIVVGNRQWVVVPVPARGWSAAAVNGWRIDAVGPVPYLVRFVK
jgi:hypothetical protein